ncbi:adenylate/guanylate cyclase domain-containing protein [Sinimarinibacterium sp. CAU 1509]|uniref:adenylate/guanylate cyclase domain-containing protein n=1 Tax=Sinimarinibacterium sp. CAU 1509 TaxID=2562283 RepID=UPI0010ACFCD8|nr:adenylate/guanylate cyclase domain-containing protein [Sinimarinibacterium sp. CAU 1509]TJY62038.1 adenylate/guanylate cyclase domain-containing protein [Sinimarinibacterium sp. CAU 1509]
MDELAVANGQHLIVALMTGGGGLILFWTDRRSAPSRALALGLVLIGVRLLLNADQQGAELPLWRVVLLARLVESAAIITGIEWARRIGLTATDALRRTVHWLFRVAQLLVLVFALMQVGYLLLAPEAATSDIEGPIRVRGYEWALFAPVLGSAALLAGIAIVILLITRTDPVESVRLRALLFASPLLLAALVIRESWVPLVLSAGLLVFLAGTIRYLILQSQRAQSLSEFLSPEVARLVKLRGTDVALRREKRRISAVVCDLRGFTAYADRQDSDTVVGLLERYYAVVGDVAAAHGGMVKDHAGDGVLILVGAPVPHRRHARRALRLARELSERVTALLDGQTDALGVGIGVASGEVTVRAIQGGGRLEYVAVGSAVNLAARLCQRAGSGEVLVDAVTLEEVERYDERPCLQRLPDEPVKGFETTVIVHRLLPDSAEIATIR